MIIFDSPYIDTNKITSKRELNNYKDDGTYLYGYCLLSQGVRLFRKDRIVKIFNEKDDLTEYNEAIHPKDINAYKKELKKLERDKNKALEICFSGVFSRSRIELQGIAKQNSLIVRKSVTKKLDFLCVGEKVGPVKIVMAENQGVCPLTEDEFIDLIETGVMPEGWMPRRD